MQSSAPCAICNGRGHAATRCPELREPLKEGFYTGGGASGGGGGGDDDDERLQGPKQIVKQPNAICV